MMRHCSLPLGWRFSPLALFLALNRGPVPSSSLHDLARVPPARNWLPTGDPRAALSIPAGNSGKSICLPPITAYNVQVLWI